MKTKKALVAQHVEQEMIDNVKKFLQEHPRIPSISALVALSIESYLHYANKYGIDADWKINFPEGVK